MVVITRRPQADVVISHPKGSESVQIRIREDILEAIADSDPRIEVAAVAMLVRNDNF